MSTIYIKPAQGPDGASLNVRLPLNPDTFLPADGAEVELTPHWQRRLNDGSVVAAAKPKRQPKTKGA